VKRVPLEAVLKEIYEKGEEQIRKIKEEAEREAERILAEAKEEAQEILRKARAEAEKEIERLRKQEISSVNLEMKKEVLNKKKEFFDMVYNDTVERIRRIDPKTKREILVKLLEGYNIGGKVYSNRDDEELVKELVKDKGLEYGGNVSCIGGIILEDESGAIRLNSTFDEIFSRTYEQKISEVSKILFG
jgi:V/A-type H+-transporting ATPase subunit E